MNNSTPTSGMMDPTCINVSDIDTLFKPMETVLFQQLYLSMTNNDNNDHHPGLITPMENDWHQFDLLDSNHHGGNSSTIQDIFLTSPNSINDTMLTPSSSPEVLFNSLIVDPNSPLLTSSTHFHQDLTSLPLSSSITSQEISTIPSSSSTITIDNNKINNNDNENKKKQKVVHTTTSPLEMMLTLDTPLKSSSSSTKISKDKSKKKVIPPAASLPVTSHIMSASTPTFTLKQANGNNKKRTHSSSTSSSSSSSIALNNNKESTSLSSSTTTIVNNNDQDMISPSASKSDNNNIPVELALKRQRNTDAARRSRLRKVQKMDSLSSRVSELETIHQQLLIRLATLETDKSILLKNEANYQSRIEQLESELTNAHVKLSQL